MADDKKSGNDDKQDEVTIQIEKKEYKSPNPTTGAALYTLGGVAAGYDLWLEAPPGKGDDERINNDATPVTLKNGAHFYLAQSSLNPGSELV